MQKNTKDFLIISVISLILISFVHLYIVLFIPPSRENIWKEIVIPNGASFKEIKLLLKKEGLIRNGFTFDILGRAFGITRRIRAGYYSLSPSMPMIEVLKVFKHGRIIEFTLTIPEGFTIDDIADALEKTGLADKAEFLSLAHNPGYVQSIGIEADSLEGYLFPDTYLLPKGIIAKEIAERMVSRFREMITPEIEGRAKELGFTVKEIITLASIIEREAQIDSERPLVSAVYHNRLRKGMLLQADPTAIYGRKSLNEKITRSDLRSHSPYNTYRIRGLPPGPIANPGKKSIKAALYPENVDYLFFVSKNDGTHYFSSTGEEHSDAVIKYRKEKESGG